MQAGTISSLRKLLRPCRLRCELGRWWQKALFVLAVGIPAALAGGKAGEIVFASVCMQIGTLPALHRAHAADFQDPEIYERIGEARLYNFLDYNPRSAMKSLERATTLAPVRPAYWEHLGLALESLREYPAAQATLARAQDLKPMSPQVHWLIANCDLSAGDTAKAFPELKRTLDLDASYSKPVYDLCLRAGVTPRIVAKLVLPDRDRARFQVDYAAYLLAEGQTGVSADVWNDAVSGGRTVELAWAQPYIAGLMRDREFTRAYQAWRDLERLGTFGNAQGADAGEQVFNGGFEREPLDTGFDWHYDPLRYVRLDFADSHAHDGRRCLRIDFTVPRNREYMPVYQDAPSESNRSYLLTAFVRSDGITSDSGPRLRVVDLNQPGDLDAASEPTLGTTAWHRIQLRFVTGRGTRFIQISVWRPRGVDFPAEISGTFWIDDVSLKPAA